MNPLELLLALAVGALVLGVFFLVRRRGERRLAEWERRFKGGAEESGLLLRPSQRQPPQGWAARFDRGFERLMEGTGFELNGGQALGLAVLLGVSLGAVLYLWRERLPLALAGLALGVLVPLGIFWLMSGRRRRQLQNQLPDALYLIARSLRAGLSLEQSIRMVGEEGVRPLADEFKRCSASLALSPSLPASLQLMASRLRLVDFNAFVSTVTFHQSTGGNLPLLLDRLAAGARDRNQFRGQFFAATAQGRVTAIALGLAVPLLLVGYVLFEPEHVQAFFMDPRGWVALAVAGILQVIGIVWLYRIMSVDY